MATVHYGPENGILPTIFQTGERREPDMSAETDHRVASYIADSWRDGSTDDVIEVVNPATAEVIGSFTAASAADVDQAVTAARAAFGVWSKTLPSRRGGTP